VLAKVLLQQHRLPVERSVGAPLAGIGRQCGRWTHTQSKHDHVQKATETVRLENVADPDCFPSLLRLPQQRAKPFAGLGLTQYPALEKTSR
jgi:hypothetical protein